VTAHASEHRLAFAPPLNPGNLFGHLAATAVPGVEETIGATFRRTVALPGGPAILALTPRAGHVACRLLLSDPADEPAALARARWLVDLDADAAAIDAALAAADPALRAAVAAGPGRRVPRTVDGAELALRAVIGQQISTAAARTHAARLAAAHGAPVRDPEGGLTRLFPTPAALRGASLAMPHSRRRTFAALVDALASGAVTLDPTASSEAHAAALDALEALPGIGPWTRSLVAMRALGDPDAFLATDLGVRHGAAALGLPADPRPLAARAEAWRPWRAYAVQYLWAAATHAINAWPPPVPR